MVACLKMYILMMRWSGGGEDNLEKIIRERLIYQVFYQVRCEERLDLDHPPMSCDLDFVGLERSSNGMYRYNDFVVHLPKSI